MTGKAAREGSEMTGNGEKEEEEWKRRRSRGAPSHGTRLLIKS